MSITFRVCFCVDVYKSICDCTCVGWILLTIVCVYVNSIHFHLIQNSLMLNVSWCGIKKLTNWKQTDQKLSNKVYRWGFDCVFLIFLCVFRCLLCSFSRLFVSFLNRKVNFFNAYIFFGWHFCISRALKHQISSRSEYIDDNSIDSYKK